MEKNTTERERRGMMITAASLAVEDGLRGGAEGELGNVREERLAGKVGSLDADGGGGGGEGNSGKKGWESEENGYFPMGTKGGSAGGGDWADGKKGFWRSIRPRADVSRRSWRRKKEEEDSAGIAGERKSVRETSNGIERRR